MSAGSCSGYACGEKRTVHASERDTPQILLARQQYRTQLASCACQPLKFVDESGCNIAMSRRYGRARRGTRVHNAVPKNFGSNVTILGAGLYAITDRQRECAALMACFTCSTDRKGKHSSMVPGSVGPAGAGMGSEATRSMTTQATISAGVHAAFPTYRNPVEIQGTAAIMISAAARAPK